MNEAEPYRRFRLHDDNVGRRAASDRVEKYALRIFCLARCIAQELTTGAHSCRWSDPASGQEVAVKIVPKRLDHLAMQEVQALQEVKRAGVSRVANLLDHLNGLDGSMHLVLEYDPGCCNLFTRRCNLDFCCRFVDGFDLYQYSEWRNETSSFSNVEGKMLTIAVQLTEASNLSCWLVP